MKHLTLLPLILFVLSGCMTTTRTASVTRNDTRQTSNIVHNGDRYYGASRTTSSSESRTVTHTPGRNDDAFTAFLADSPESAARFLDDARANCEHLDWTTCKELAMAVTTREHATDRQKADAYLLAGVAACMNHEPQSARTCFLEAAKLCPECVADPYLLTGDMLRLYEEARSHAQKGR